MPYIYKEQRQKFEGMFTDMPTLQSPGELNYVLTTVCQQYIQHSLTGTNYRTYNDIIGALEACKLEFYRRAVSPYEDTKIQTNGDVYQ